MGKGLGILAAGLAVWYIFHGTPKEYERNSKRYSLPDKIEVIEANYHKKGTGLETKFISNAKEKNIETEDIDFSEDFVIKTDRYNLIKDEDWLPSRIVGHTLAMPTRLLFWDWDYGWGQDEERTRAVVSMLEKDTTVKDITVRLNHNEAFYDCWRMFTEDKLQERNNVLARIVLGIPLSLFNEVFAEFSRGSYYNPLTNTAVCYSNIESITAHEIGHHKDFHRFDSDWEYELARILPPVMLYQEWQASTNARNDLLIKEDEWQFDRYLIPAFATYVFATIVGLKRFSKKEREKREQNKRELKKEIEKLMNKRR